MARPSAADTGAPPPTLLGRAAADWAVSRWVDVQERRVRYREAGEGPAVVLVHGLGVSADYWVRVAPRLAAAGFRVLAPDLPGFGRTPGSPDGLGVSGQVNAVRRWADAMSIDSAVYVGHSLSCQSALEFAAHYPERVRGLVLAAPTGYGPKWRRLVRQLTGLLVDIPRESAKFAIIVAGAYLRAGPRRVFRTWARGAEHDPLLVLDRIRVPVLIVTGGADPVVPAAFVAQLVAGLRDTRTVDLPDAPHGLVFEPTSALNDALTRFLREIASRRVNPFDPADPVPPEVPPQPPPTTPEIPVEPAPAEPSSPGDPVDPASPGDPSEPTTPGDPLDPPDPGERVPPGFVAAPERARGARAAAE